MPDLLKRHPRSVRPDVSAPAAIARASATHWIALAVLMAGAFLPPVDFFIVNVTLPSIHESLGASPGNCS